MRLESKMTIIQVKVLPDSGYLYAVRPVSEGMEELYANYGGVLVSCRMLFKFYAMRRNHESATDCYLNHADFLEGLATFAEGQAVPEIRTDMGKGLGMGFVIVSDGRINFFRWAEELGVPELDNALYKFAQEDLSDARRMARDRVNIWEQLIVAREREFFMGYWKKCQELEANVPIVYFSRGFTGPF